MKKSKIIAPAAAILVFSSAAAVTGTVAWFTASNLVSVDGLNMKAEAENGIVIANETHTADSNWKVSVSASHDGKVSSEQQTFIPTSTSNLSNWYHGLSDAADNGQSNVSYEEFTVDTSNLGTSGVATGTTTNQVKSAKNIYLLNKFYVQASAQTDITGQDLYIKGLAVTGNNTSANLDKSLRVGVGYTLPGGSFTFSKIFAPITGATLQYNVNGSTTNYDVTAIADTSAEYGVTLISNADIKAYTTAGTNAIELSFYLYFEGEDSNHKSANITNSLDTLSIEFSLGNTNHA